jgi:hypothetical protein
VVAVWEEVEEPELVVEWVAGGWVVPVQVLVREVSVFVPSVELMFLTGRASLVIK